LVVEVARDSLRADRTLKKRIYAGAYVPDYWIVNLVNRLVEVYREPFVDPGQRWTYRAMSLGRPGERLAPLAAPAARIAVDDLLP